MRHAPSVSAVWSVLESSSIDTLETAGVDWIARSAGVSRRSASRALGELEKAGRIRTEWVRTGKRGGQYYIRVVPDEEAVDI
jgi:predicted transcriptional regulator